MDGGKDGVGVFAGTSAAGVRDNISIGGVPVRLWEWSVKPSL